MLGINQQTLADLAQISINTITKIENGEININFQKLYATGALLTAREVPALNEDSSILNDMSLYSEMTGLTLEPEMGKAEFI